MREQVIAVSIVLIAAGALVNRLWFAALPAAALAGLIAYSVVLGQWDGNMLTGESGFFLFVVAGIGATVCLFAGVLARRLARAGRGADQRRTFSPQ